MDISEQIRSLSYAIASLEDRLISDFIDEHKECYAGKDMKYSFELIIYCYDNQTKYIKCKGCGATKLVYDYGWIKYIGEKE